MKGIPGFLAHIYNHFTKKDPILQDLFHEIAGDLMVQISSGRILDVGTGPGFLPLAIARRIETVEIIGVDISKGMVKIAQKNLRKTDFSKRVSFLVSDAAQLDFEDNSFKFIISTLAIPFWKTPRENLREICRVLKSRGEAWIYDLNRDISIDMENTIVKKYGRFRAFKYLRLMRSKYNMTMTQARLLVTAAGLGCSKGFVEEKGLFLRLRLIK
jgi:ubiquinone/menaquinone biosynthesis C-methylase UbiE